MEEDYKPAVQHQRRVNPKIHDVIKNEVEKLLDAGLIYPISDSPWVSPIHCVPKKGGFTVVQNEEEEDNEIEDFLVGQNKSVGCGTFTITQSIPYGTVVLSQTNGPRISSEYGHRVKHYFGWGRNHNWNGYLQHRRKTKQSDKTGHEMEKTSLCRLNGLELSDTEFGSNGLRHLSGLANLQSLNLSFTLVTDGGLGNLSKFLTLRSLNLDVRQIKDTGLASLRSSTGFTHLDLFCAKITDAWARILSPCIWSYICSFCKCRCKLGCSKKRQASHFATWHYCNMLCSLSFLRDLEYILLFCNKTVFARWIFVRVITNIVESNDVASSTFRMFNNKDVTIGAWMLAMNVNHEDDCQLCQPECTAKSVVVWDIPKCSGWKEDAGTSLTG
ncbi:reverse transcriptase domain-containing protein [Tanacetum coccineum]